jgi:hypothetical protein
MQITLATIEYIVYSLVYTLSKKKLSIYKYKKITCLSGHNNHNKSATLSSKSRQIDGYTNTSTIHYQLTNLCNIAGKFNIHNDIVTLIKL